MYKHEKGLKMSEESWSAALMCAEQRVPHIPGWLAPYVEEVWRVEASDSPCAHLILPDNCMDIIQRQGQWFLVGPSTRSFVSQLDPGQEAWGVRFAPGMLPVFTGWDARDVRDQCVPLRMFGHLDVAREMRKKLDCARVGGTLAMLEGMRRSRARTVGQLAAELGWSERHLQRKLLPLLGYSARTWLKVNRLRAMVARLQGGSLLEVALQAGFADQAHMSRECKLLTGLTPGQLRRHRAQTASS